MSTSQEQLQQLIAEIAVLIDQDIDLNPQAYTLFFHHPDLILQLIELMGNLEEHVAEESPAIYSACVFAFDICLTQLQSGAETNNKISTKVLAQLMSYLAKTINTHKHSLNYWLPILNAFYDGHVDLAPELKEAYYDLVNLENNSSSTDELSHLNSIRDLINELSDLSVFEIAEHFFAQSYAMPADFFTDLILDLYSIAEGHDIAILTLLHPKADIRDIAVTTLDLILDRMVLSSNSLSRLQIIKSWYPESYRPMFDRWIKNQRRKGVIFNPETEVPTMEIKATEVDGSYAQGIFIRTRYKRKSRLGGLLLKYNFGIKEAWVTPVIPAAEVKSYYEQAFDENVTFREVDVSYLELLVSHFLAVMIEQGEVPGLHFLELQELIGLRLRPHRMDIPSLIEQLSVQIIPFTSEFIDASLKRSNAWLKNKAFTESWFTENPLIDKIVNHNSSFVDGVKVCRLEEAIDAVFAQEMEINRDEWQFYFLWIALWFKAKAKKNEKLWQDSFLIAYLIHEGHPLNEIPVMREICRQTVINSVETMHERRTYLSQE